jgi:hypothetical protein
VDKGGSCGDGITAVEGDDSAFIEEPALLLFQQSDAMDRAVVYAR